MNEKPLWRRESFWLMLAGLTVAIGAVILESAEMLGMEATVVSIIGIVVTVCTRLTNKTGQDKIRLANLLRK